jgi:hypothetical protein
MRVIKGIKCKSSFRRSFLVEALSNGVGPRDWRESEGTVGIIVLTSSQQEFASSVILSVSLIAAMFVLSGKRRYQMK